MINIKRAITPKRKAGENRIEPPARVSPKSTRLIEKGTEMMIVVMLNPTAEKGLIPATN
jgi:hypothetical protein